VRGGDCALVLAVFAELAAAVRAGGPVKVAIHLPDPAVLLLHETLDRRLVNIDMGSPGRASLVRLAAQLRRDMPPPPERFEPRRWGPRQ
jgi:hypothetical protein